MRRQESLELCRREHEAAQGLGGDDIRDGHLAQKAGDLAEEVARFQRAAIGAVQADRGGPFEDDVEARSADSLAQDPLTFAEEGLVKKVRDLLELRPGQVGKQREGRDRVDDVVANGHYRPSFSGCPAPAETSRATALPGSWIPIAFTMAPTMRSAAPTIIARWKDAVDASRTRLPRPGMPAGVSGLTALRKAGSLTL